MTSVSNREQRYAEAIAGGKERAAILVTHNPGELANAYRDARAVMAVADAELAEARAEIEDLARGVIPNYTLDLLDIAREFKEVEGRPVLARWIRAVAALAPKDPEATR